MNVAILCKQSAETGRAKKRSWRYGLDKKIPLLVVHVLRWRNGGPLIGSFETLSWEWDLFHSGVLDENMSY